LLWLFWRWGSCKLFAQGGLEPSSFQSQPLKLLGLQVSGYIDFFTKILSSRNFLFN
jgi:hypothetical protein